MRVTKERAEQILVEGCSDDEKWNLAKQWLQAEEAKKELAQEIRDTARGCAEEATWTQIQGEDYGSF